MFIDTHSHLNFNEFDDDRDQVIKRAHDAGVEKMIIVGSNLDDSKLAIELAQKSESLYASVGIHPNNIGLNWQKDLRELELELEKDKVVALGGIGLDYHQGAKTGSNKRAKTEAFTTMLGLAVTKKLPVILHCREARGDFLTILKNQTRTKGVWHCFQGDRSDAQRAFELGLFISFTGATTFNRDCDEVIRYAPLEKIMIETDCPFLTPEPYRGKRNEPAYVVEVARRIAEIKDVPYFRVAEETTKNAIKLFGLDKF